MGQTYGAAKQLRLSWAFRGKYSESSLFSLGFFEPVMQGSSRHDVRHQLAVPSSDYLRCSQGHALPHLSTNCPCRQSHRPHETWLRASSPLSKLPSPRGEVQIFESSCASPCFLGSFGKPFFGRME